MIASPEFLIAAAVESGQMVISPPEVAIDQFNTIADYEEARGNR